jgi:NADH-quinone oxidoreductase subunit K
MILIAAAMAGIGLACVLYRRTLIGLLVGLQLMVLAASMMFMLAGVGREAARVQGQIAGLWVLLFGLVATVAGCAVSLRLFYLKRRASLEDVRALRQ